MAETIVMDIEQVTRLQAKAQLLSALYLAYASVDHLEQADSNMLASVEALSADILADVSDIKGPKQSRGMSTS